MKHETVTYLKKIKTKWKMKCKRISCCFDHEGKVVGKVGFAYWWGPHDNLYILLYPHIWFAGVQCIIPHPQMHLYHHARPRNELTFFAPRRTILRRVPREWRPLLSMSLFCGASSSSTRATGIAAVSHLYLIVSSKWCFAYPPPRCLMSCW